MELDEQTRRALGVQQTFDEDLEQARKSFAGRESYDSGGRRQGVDIRNAPGRSRRYIPEFAANDAQLRSILVHAAIGYAFRLARPPEVIVNDLKYLDGLARNRTAYEKALIDGSDNERWNLFNQHIAAIEQAGSYLSLLGAITYRAWRLGWHSKDIADSVGMNPAAVDRQIRKLILIGHFFGFATCPRRRYSQQKIAEQLRKDQAIVELWSSGKTVPAIEKELHASTERVHWVLKQAGIYEPNRKSQPSQSNTTPEAILAVWESGEHKPVRIAKKLGTTPATVVRFLKRQGLYQRAPRSRWYK